MAAHRLALIQCSLLASLVACFDPPELDEPTLPPLLDLGSVDTWAPLDEAGPPAGEPPASDGASESALETGTEETAVDPALMQLRITEVLVDPDGKDGGLESPEFVEIKNLGPSPAKLDGLRIEAMSWPDLSAADLGLDDVTLGVDELLVVRRWTSDLDPALAQISIEQGVVWAGFLHSGGLRNSDGTVLLQAGAMSIDQLVYTMAAGSGVSMCTDGRDEWSPCSPTPGSPNSEDGGSTSPDPIAPGALVIVEVSANPPGPSSEEKAYEYIEILNISEDQLELDGCRIGDAAELEAPGLDPLEYLAGDGGCESPTCLAPGARALIVGQGYLGESGGALVLATDDSTIADGGLTNTEPVVLWDSTGAMVSSYRLWSDPAGDPLPADEQPLHRLEPLAADDPQSWISAPPTPGT